MRSSAPALLAALLAGCTSAPPDEALLWSDPLVHHPEHPEPGYRGDPAQLDELIRATQGAHNVLLDLEHIDDQQFERYRRSYSRLAAAARRKLERGELDTDSPELKDLRHGRTPPATTS
jgi:Low affinity iron permease